MTNNDILLDSSNLRELIRILQIADKHGFGLSQLSSPIDILLNAIIDMILLLKTQLSVGSKFRKNNPGMIFSDKISDALGNPKQILFRKKERLLWDPQASDILLSLASALVLVKNGKSLRKAFMAFSQEILINDIAALEKTQEDSKNLTNRNINSQRASRHWYRRQQRSK